MAIKLMLIDDSAIIRELIRRALIANPEFDVVAMASDGALAIPLAKQCQPDIIILDIEMPNMDGLTALPKLLEVAPKAKVIMASTLTVRNAGISLQAMLLGASDYVAKPMAQNPQQLEEFYRDLVQRIRALAGHKTAVSVPLNVMRPSTGEPLIAPVRALAIASSTGGPQALMTLFAALKGQFQRLPIFVTQHMPPTFTTVLAEHIAKAGERICREGKEGDVVTPGNTYVAPGDYHMVAEKRGMEVLLRTTQTSPENFCRPAADPMLRSLSAAYGSGLLTVVLTGMGSDGLEGAKIAVKNGGQVIAQDEATSVVWGMPRAVVEQGICRAVLPLSGIAPYLVRLVPNA